MTQQIEHLEGSMKISLLVPVYGVEKYIAKCARSLFGQTYPNIEYIFVNDATPDSSIEVLREVMAEYPERAKQVKIIEHQVNRGISTARNTALDNATGDYVWHIDSDDFIESDAVAQLAAAALSGDADIIVFDSNGVHMDRKEMQIHRIGSNVEEYITKLLTRRLIISMWCKIIRRDLYVSNGVRFIDGISFNDDCVTSPRIAFYARKIMKINAPLYNYVINPDSITKKVDRRCANDAIRVVEILDDFFSATPYAAHIPMMKIRNKIKLMNICHPSLRPDVANLYSELDYRKLPISAPDKLMLWLAGQGAWRLLDIHINQRHKIKRAIKKIRHKKIVLAFIPKKAQVETQLT